MADVTVNGLAVMNARVMRPRVGVWTGELQVDAQTAAALPAGTAVTLAIGAGGFQLQGTVLRSGEYAQNVTMRVVGGRNGLSKLCKPRFYQGTTVQAPVQDALKDAGEVLSSASNPQSLSSAIGFWSMVQQPASEALSSLADASSVEDTVWRVNADGSIFFGADAFLGTLLSDYELVDSMPLEGVQVLAAENPEVNPGESFDGNKISAVEHVVTAEHSRVRLWFE